MVITPARTWSFWNNKNLVCWPTNNPAINCVCRHFITAEVNEGQGSYLSKMKSFVKPQQQRFNIILAIIFPSHVITVDLPQHYHFNIIVSFIFWIGQKLFGFGWKKMSNPKIRKMIFSMTPYFDPTRRYMLCTFHDFCLWMEQNWFYSGFST